MYSTEDGDVTITSDIVPIPFPCNSGTEIDFDPGSERKLAPGMRESPLYVIVGSAKPVLSIKFGSALEYQKFWAQYPAIPGSTVTISHVFFRIDLGMQNWQFGGIIPPAPGYKVGDGGYTYDAKFLPLTVEMSGSSIFLT